MKPNRILAALCCLAISVVTALGASGKKISDYTETLTVGDAWLYEIAVPGVTNYKVTFGTMATNIIARVPDGGGGSLVTNANQFGASATLTLKSGALITNLTLPSLTASRPAFINAGGVITNASGTPDGTKFLRDDGVLIAPSTSGTASNAVANLIGQATNLTAWGGTTNQGNLYMVGHTLPATSNTYDRGSFLFPDRTNWVNDVVAKEAIYISGTDGSNGIFGTTPVTGTTPHLHWPGNENFFAGPSVGNLSMTGAAGGTSGNRNVGMGYQVLQSLTTGHRNIGIGFAVLSSLTSGSYNTVIGMASLADATDCSHNVGVGHHTQRTTTSGSANTSLGDYTLELNLTGNNGVAIGYQALGKANANNNTAIGFESGKEITNGTLNTSGGAYSLHAAYDGVGNTAWGYASLGDSIGSYNTGIGGGALGGGTTAMLYNVGLGWQAGANVSGNYNTILGAHAAANGITSGARNTMIGYDVLMANNAGNNQLNIGNLLFGTGLGTGLIYGTGNIGIGITNPASKLSVSGSGSFGEAYATTAAPTDGLLILGNVGIGTNAPGYKLEVNGTARITGAVMLNNGSPAAGQVATFRSDGTIYPSNVVAGTTQMVAAAIGTLTVTNWFRSGDGFLSSNLWVTGNISTPEFYASNAYFSSVFFTNRLTTNVVSLGVEDLTNSAAFSPQNGDLLGWNEAMKRWTNATPQWGDVVTNINVSAGMDNVLLDFAVANVFKLTLRTNLTYTFTNNASLMKRAKVYFQQDLIGARTLSTYYSVGGIIQTNANMQFNTNAGAVDLMGVEKGFWVTNLLTDWQRDYNPRISPALLATFTDDFNRANDDPMTIGASDGVGTWTSGPGFYNDCFIDYNTLRGSTGSDNMARVLTPTFLDNQSASVTLAGTSGLFVNCGPAVRIKSITDGDCYMAVAGSTTSITVFMVTDDGATITDTPLGASFTVPELVVGSRIALSVSGTILTLYVNEVSQGTRTDGTYTTGQPGIRMANTTGGADAFSATDL